MRIMTFEVTVEVYEDDYPSEVAESIKDSLEYDFDVDSVVYKSTGNSTDED